MDPDAALQPRAAGSICMHALKDVARFSCLSILVAIAWPLITTGAETGAARTPAREARAAPRLLEWEVGIVTSGGFAGSGKGMISLRSDGAFTPRFPCKLLPERLADVESAVAVAQPGRWHPTYTRQSLMSDQFYYSLSLRTKTDDGVERSYKVTWKDETLADLPPDLRDLYEAVWAARQQLKGDCR
jgi:hypothetical protein